MALGGQVSFPITGKIRYEHSILESSEIENKNLNIASPFYSINLGLGFEYRLSKQIHIDINPLINIGIGQNYAEYIVSNKYGIGGVIALNYLI